MGKLWTVADFIFLGSKITADGDCSHEIERGLLLGRKVMTNLDSILKSRDRTTGLSGKSPFCALLKIDEICLLYNYFFWVLEDGLSPHSPYNMREVSPPLPNA